jgi:hypothetical protein
VVVHDGVSYDVAMKQQSIRIVAALLTARVGIVHPTTVPRADTPSPTARYECPAEFIGPPGIGR